jgi:putative ABC transport system permease protein
MTISTAGTKEAEPAVRAAFFAEALARIRAVPGVGSASYINHLPIVGDQWGFPFAVEGRPKPKPGESPTATYRVVFPGYFATMRIPLLRGRDIIDADRAGAQKVVVVNKYMADKHWPGEDPIGKRITLDDSTWVSVVGVAKNTVREDWAAPAEEEMFLPFLQDAGFQTDPRGNRAYLTLVARAACDGADRCDVSALSAPIVRAVREIDRNMPVSDVQTMTHVVNEATAESRFYLLLLGAFAVIAVTLAAVGIYGVMSYSVARRTHEIGIRIALGAEPGSVVAGVVGSGLRLAAAGAAAGLLGAFALTRLMWRLLFAVSAVDPWTFAAATLLLGLVAVAASYVPARRTTRVDPLEALRAD